MRASGKHTTPRRKVPAPESGWAGQDATARALGVPWSNWAARVLERAAMSAHVAAAHARLTKHTRR